jgi:hypothetical protein
MKNSGFITKELLFLALNPGGECLLDEISFQNPALEEAFRGNGIINWNCRGDNGESLRFTLHNGQVLGVTKYNSSDEMIFSRCVCRDHSRRVTSQEKYLVDGKSVKYKYSIFSYDSDEPSKERSGRVNGFVAEWKMGENPFSEEDYRYLNRTVYEPFEGEWSFKDRGLGSKYTESEKRTLSEHQAVWIPAEGFPNRNFLK